VVDTDEADLDAVLAVNLKGVFFGCAAAGRIMQAGTGRQPARLVGEPADIAYAMLYLASDASRFVTGTVLRPNGGVHMQ
jgi:NAD(P)-dependent dehydrogenase (short-subunit alcohol dehydrogenase family)